MSLLKNFTLAGSLLASSLSPLHADEILNLSLNTQSAEKEALQHVDKHVVFIIDRSSSMKIQELAILRDSLIGAFDDNETMDMAFSNSKAYAMTFVSFAGRSKITDTYIVNNRKEALAAVVDALFSKQTSSMGYSFRNESIGTSTVMNNALKDVVWLFEEGENSRGIQSGSKVVIIMGDDKPYDSTMSALTAKTIQYDYRASLFCVPIIPNENLTMADIAYGTNFYTENFQTVKGGLRVPNKYGGQDIVPEGHCAVAKNSQDGAHIISMALRPVGG